MPKEFIANFNLEKQDGQNANFEITNNEVNANFNIQNSEEISATFDVLRAAGVDKYFVFEQGTSSSIWTITHNLNKKAAVTVVDEYDRVVTPAVEYVSDNEIILRFNFAFKGKAYLN